MRLRTEKDFDDVSANLQNILHRNSKQLPVDNTDDKDDVQVPDFTYLDKLREEARLAREAKLKELEEEKRLERERQ